MPVSGGFAFGHYELDLRAKRLLRGGERVPVTERQVEVLGALLRDAGKVVAKDDLVRAGWGEIALSDNSLAQVLSQLRATLDAENPDRYIANAPGRGYRFVAPVETMDAALVDADLDGMMTPHRVLMDGRAALEALERDQIAKTRLVFE